MGCTCSLMPKTDSQAAMVRSKPASSVPHVSSSDVRGDSVGEIVGHTRRLEDEYSLGPQIGK